MTIKYGSAPAVKWKCRYCFARNDYYSRMCPRCWRSGAAMVPENLSIPEPRPRINKLISSLGREPHTDVPRMSTGFANLDIMFGGGIAVGSVVQLGGEPGIGKSTLLGQIVAFMAENGLYVTSEESKRRLANRIRRVAGEEAADKVDSISTLDDRLSIDEVLTAISSHPAKFMVMDSLQGFRRKDAKHSQNVVRDNALDIISEANARRVTVIMTCHVNKAGDIAGLKEISHMVDTVAWFKGKPETLYREVFCTKNRDGDTSIRAHFEMGDHGLTPCEAPPDEKQKKREEKEFESHTKEVEAFRAEVDGIAASVKTG